MHSEVSLAKDRMAEILAGLVMIVVLAVIAGAVVLDRDIRRGMGVYALILLVGCAVPAFLGSIGHTS
jgi:hypothetical protein